MAFTVPRREDSPVERTLRVSIYEGTASTVFINWTTGSVLTGYLLYLGASPLQLSFLASLPLLAQALNPLALYISHRWPDRRRVTSALAGVGRCIWAVAVAAPFLMAEPSQAVGIVLAVVGLSSVLQSFAGLVWTTWMADVVPEERRGRYFGLRNGICAVAGVVANFAAGAYLDRVAAPHSFQTIISLAILFACVGVWLYGKQWDPPSRRSRRPPHLGRAFRQVMADVNYRRFLIFILYWQASVLIAAPFVIPYFIDYLGMSFTDIAVWAAIAAVLTLLLGPVWGRVADHVGNKPVLTVTTIISGTAVPVCWILATPENHGFIWVSALFEALAWSAINPAMFNLMLATAKPSQRMSYLAFLGVFAGIAGFLGATLSGMTLELIRDSRVEFAGFAWTGYHTLFFVSGACRSFAWRLLQRVHETRAWTRVAMIGAIRRWRLTGFTWR